MYRRYLEVCAFRLARGVALPYYQTKVILVVTSVIPTDPSRLGIQSRFVV